MEFFQMMQRTNSPNRGKNWHRADIIAALHKKGISLSQLSRDMGLSRSTLRNALDRKWPKGERLIAQAIGVPPEKIWPQRYAPLGSRLRRQAPLEERAGPTSKGAILSLNGGAIPTGAFD